MCWGGFVHPDKNTRACTGCPDFYFSYLFTGLRSGVRSEGRFYFCIKIRTTFVLCLLH